MSFMKHTDEIQYLKSSPDIIQMIKIIIMRCVGHVAQIYEMKNALKNLIWKPEWKRSLEICRHRREDIIKMDLKGKSGKLLIWPTGSGYGPIVGCCEHDNKPSGSIKKREISSLSE